MSGVMGDKVIISLFEHKELLEKLGYEIDSRVLDLLQTEGDFYKRASILYNGRRVGSLGLEIKNMYYFEQDGQIVGNKDLNTINFSTRKSKNKRTLIHTYIRQGGLYINCFNMLHNEEDRNYICLTDNENVSITKVMDDEEIIVKSLKEDISDDEVLETLRKREVVKRLSYTIGDVIDEHKN